MVAASAPRRALVTRSAASMKDGYLNNRGRNAHYVSFG